MDIIETAQDKMNKTIAVLNRDLGSLRAGRANPKLLDRIMVDYYGTPTPINQMGTVSSPEPRLLVISLWDASMISAAEKAIQKSDLGINPSNDGKLIRLVFPELTEERRKELVKIVRKKAEESKVAIRAIRREANETIKKDCKDGTITEDDQKRLEEKAQKATDNAIKEIDRVEGDSKRVVRCLPLPGRSIPTVQLVFCEFKTNVDSLRAEDAADAESTH